VSEPYPPSERFIEIAGRVRNWGRWGPDDQIGTLNFIDESVRARAAACVQLGRALPLGLPLSEAEGIQMGFVPGRVNPQRSMIAINGPLRRRDPEGIASSEDVVTMALQCATHWDALAHVSYGGNLYNGYPASSITEAGAGYCGIHHVRTLISRGVLLDVPRAKGVEVLEPGYPITPGDLDLAAELAGVGIERGDVLLVRTGQMVHLNLEGDPAKERNLEAYTWPTPGLSMATAPWFHERDVAAVATDTMTLEVFPCEEKAAYLPVHLLHLVEMGMTQGQNFVLDPLAHVCAEQHRYTFLLDATPLGFTAGLGSPVNPVALL
jgi:kynurenine formamidase